MDLPSCFKPQNVEKEFMRLYLTVLDVSCKSLANKKLQRKFEKILKWTMRILNKYLFKYIHPDKSEDHYHSSDWIHSYAYDIWDKVISILEVYNASNSCSIIMANVMKAAFYLLDFRAIYKSKIERVTEEGSERLIKVLFTCLILSPHEFKYFEEHQADFIKNNDPEVQQEVSLFRYYTIKVLALVIEESSFQTSLLRLCNSQLKQASNQSHQDAKSAFTKEMVYSSLQVTSSWLVKTSLSSSLGDLFELHLIHDLIQTPFTFLQVRILTLLATLVKDGLPEYFAVPLFSKVKAYLQDESSSVRLAAVLLVEQLLKFASVRSLFSREDGQRLIDLTLNTMVETENETLAATFEGMMGYLDSFLEGSYIGILNKLIEAFLKFTDHMKSLELDLDDPKELEEKFAVCRTSQNCLALMNDIVLHKTTQSCMQEVESILFPVLDRCLVSFHEDLLGEGNIF
jgi:hypothetical protein